ncbi:hypothetical protein [Synechococcus sp. NOUM97013]|uniref:hypothetical protein n=1 Tax=Synechococcus sp. NOUM97013 TaxID=1442555 RepID=UPI001645521A|nr:hypothetical protein [Synechococcus sp. NOUM97013]
MTPSDYAPPSWMELKPFIYKQWLQRQALTVTKRDRKRGGSYRVKDAMDAIHAAAHQSDGIDPYDGQPMNASLLETKNPTLSTSQEADQLALARRCPMVKHTRGALICDFEIMSRQTADAKGGMSTEEYIEHCRAVVRYRGKNDFKTAGSVH